MTGRRSFLRSLAALLAAAAGRVQGAAAEGARVALVIGNNGYPTHPLVNAANDARAVADVLRGAEFDVAMHIDANGEAMAQAVRDFGAALQRPAVKLAAFYYAGHGVQVDWRNYLLPVDARIQSLEQLRRQAFDLGSVLAALPRTGDKAYVLILDACRDNPFGEALKVERKGLSPFDAPVGTLIAFSTSPGSVASDGSGGNGLYTENLVRELGIRGQRIEDAFKRVRANVSLASRGTQVPWESTSLVGDVFLYPPPAPPSEEELERQLEAEVAQWNRIKGSKDPADWAALLRAFPNGKLSEIAQARLNMLLAPSAALAATRQLVVKPAYVELGQGRPVPAYFARDANPNSAGTFPIDRLFQVGDRAEYEVHEDEGPGGKTRMVRRVTRVDTEAGLVEMNDGNHVTDLLGNPIRTPESEFAVPAQEVPAELQVGRRWSASYRELRKQAAFDSDFEYAIVGRERVDVPAGSFDAFRIEGHTSAVQRQQRGRKSRFARRSEKVLWEVPGLNFPVKQERTVYHRDGRITHDGFALVSLRQGTRPD